MTSPAIPPAPPARRDDVVDLLHGVEVADPYRWLEADDSDDTRSWIDAQDRRTRAVLDALPERARLHGQLSGLLRAGTSSAPRLRGDRVFSLDRWGDLDQAVLVVRSAVERDEPQIVVDPHALTGDATAALDWYHPSPDGRLVAYGISSGGDERSTLYVIDVATGERLSDEIAETRAASVAWLPDGSEFAYTRYPPGDEYGRHVRWHRLGDDSANDAVVFDDLPDHTAWPEVSISSDGNWLLVHVGLGWTRVDVHLIERATGTRTTMIEGQECVSGFKVAAGRLIGLTTEGADRRRIVTAALAAPQAEHWTTVVPESDAVIESFAATGSSLLVTTTSRAVSYLHHYALDGSGGREVALPELGSLAGISASDDDDIAALSFTSFTRPPTLFRWTPDAGLEQWSNLPGAPDPAAYDVEQARYASTDGTEISMFLIRARNEGDREAARPAILTAYGGFGLTMSPAYSPPAVAWCDDGGLYAVACIRGGAEEGEAWHRAGMRANKQQVFDDFYAAADWLVDQGHTSRDRLATRGGSNGGLLMGAVITQRPDLCRAVHCAVPLLDMLRFHLFLIARLWMPEYGDPDVAEDFGWLHAYSPYHHVREGVCYPATLITTGEGDSRVHPSHARKMAALLQAATACGDERPILLRYETAAGHGQGKPASKQADELADVFAFLGWQLGVSV